jgi:hypothetical protein
VHAAQLIVRKGSDDNKASLQANFDAFQRALQGIKYFRKCAVSR